MSEHSKVSPEIYDVHNVTQRCCITERIVSKVALCCVVVSSFRDVLLFGLATKVESDFRYLRFSGFYFGLARSADVFRVFTNYSCINSRSSRSAMLV